MIALTKDGLVITGEKIYVDPELQSTWSWTLYSKLRLIIRCNFIYSDKATSCCKMAFAAFDEFDSNHNYKNMPTIVAQNSLSADAG